MTRNDMAAAAFGCRPAFQSVTFWGDAPYGGVTFPESPSRNETRRGASSISCVLLRHILLLQVSLTPIIINYFN